MNGLDILIILVIIASFIFGLIKGFVKIIVFLSLIIVGFFLATQFYENGAELLMQWVKNMGLAEIIAFMIIFIGIILCFAVIGWILRKFLKALKLTWGDRLLGAGVGAIVGILIASIVLLSFTSFLPVDNSIVVNSQLAPTIMKITSLLANMVPSDLKAQFKEKYNLLKEYWEKRKVV